MFLRLLRCKSPTMKLKEIVKWFQENANRNSLDVIDGISHKTNKVEYLGCGSTRYVFKYKNLVIKVAFLKEETGCSTSGREANQREYINWINQSYLGILAKIYWVSQDYSI